MHQQEEESKDIKANEREFYAILHNCLYKED